MSSFQISVFSCVNWRWAGTSRSPYWLTPLCRKGEYSRPEAAICRKACWQGCPRLVSDNLNMRRCPPLLDEGLTMPRPFAQTTYFMLNTCLPSESLPFWYMLGRGMPMWPASNKKPGHWVSKALPWRTTFHMHCHSSLLEELSVSCMTLPGEDSSKLVSSFLWTLSHVPFLSVDCALCPFAVINRSFEYGYVPSPESS